MCMSTKASLRLDAVFVDYPQAAEAIMSLVIVTARLISSMIIQELGYYSPGKAKGVEGLQPSVVSVAALSAGAKNELHGRDRGRGKRSSKDFMRSAESTSRRQRSEERQLVCASS